MKTTITLITLTAVALTLPLAGANAQSGSLDTTFMARVGPNSNVNAIVVQPDGKTVFGGSFTQVNSTPLNRLARADADGNVDATFAIGSGADGVVNALALQGDGGILIAGSFTNFNGTPRPGLARVTPGGSLDLSFNPGSGTDGEVSFVAWQTNGQVIIQGDFTTFNGTPRLGLARLNADGSLDPTYDPGARAADVSALACQTDGKVVFSGSFTSLDGFAVNNLARLNADGSLDTNFTALASLNHHADSVVVQRDGNILLTGEFTAVNGVLFNRIARLSPDGSLDPGFNPGTGVGMFPFTSPVRSVEQPDGRLLIWGLFTNYNGVAITNYSAARLHPNGSFDPSFRPPTSFFAVNYGKEGVPYLQTNVCVQADGRILVGWHLPGTSWLPLRRLLADGSVDASWMSETGAAITVGDLTSSTVRTMALQSDGKSLLGGTFTQINGMPRIGLARLHTDGRLDTNYNPNLEPSAGVYSIALQPDGKLVVGGSFTSVNGQARTNLARLHPDGSLDTTLNPTFDTSEVVESVLRQPDGKLVIGGSFVTGPGAQDWTSVIRLNDSGSRDASFNVRLQDVGGTIWDESFSPRLALQSDGKIVVAGQFAVVNGLPQKNLARLNPDGSLDTGFDPGLPPSEWIRAIALQPDGKLLVGGDFYVGSDTVPGLVRLQPDGRLDGTFASQYGRTTPGVFAFLVQPDGRILIGGDSYTGLRVARLNPDGQWDVTFNPGTGPNGPVHCLALQPDGRLLIGGTFGSVSGMWRGRVARLVNEMTAPPVCSPTAAYVTSWASSNATFDVFLIGLPPFSFQWQCNGTNLPGQTNLQCSLSNLAASDAGLYTLVVSNASGTATSAPARLTVLPASARPGTFDTGFAPGSGADKSVWSLMEQTDGKLLVTGFFGTFNGEPHGGLVRLNRDGLVDTNFLASGVESGREVYWAMPQPDGKLLVGGWFNYFNGAPRTNLVRLHPDGRLDDSFTASVDVLNPNAYVYPMAGQPDRKILVGGLFSEVNGTPRNNLARLEPDGSLDSSFDPGAGADDYTWAIVLQPDGKILVGGGFTHFNGVTRGGITRLNANGSMDASFNPGTAANGEVDVIVLQPDGKIVIGGGFSAFNGVPRTHLARLNPDGSLDATFVPAAPAWLVGSIIYGIVLQADGKLVAGAYQSGGAAACIARFNPDGSLDSSYALGVCNSDGVWCMTGLANGQILVGGNFTDFNGLPAGRIVRLHGDEAIAALAPFSLGARWNAGVFELGLFGEAGRSYTIEASAGLPAFSLWTNITSTGTNWLADPETSTSPQRFYRARTSN